MKKQSVALGACVLVGVLLGSSIAFAEEPRAFAPVERPGPALTAPAEELADSLECTGEIGPGAPTPVLMMAGAFSSPEEFSSWNYQRDFRSRGIPFCTLTLPHNGVGEAQRTAQFVVAAIRTMHEEHQGKISIFGQSLGGMIGRWALRFWPDLRPMVDDYVALAPPNHSTFPFVDAVCLLPCSEGAQQGEINSEFYRALNSYQETFAPISYTVVSSRFDEVVPAITGSSALRTGDGAVRNVQTQDICPLDVSDHITVTVTSSVAHALTIDALSHPGPADPARINRNVCLRPLMPAIDPVTLPLDLLGLGTEFTTTFLFPGPRTTTEPELDCYVYATGCPGE